MPTPNDIRVDSWESLNAELFQDSWQAALGRWRSPYTYRGLADVEYDLKTSLIRLGGNYRRLEAVLLRNFRKYAHRDASPGDSLWNWLALAQHHGLPTRLLDWSYSPFVALHFATIELEKYDCDGLIWCVDYIKVIQWLPPVLRELLQQEMALAFNVDMLSGIASSFQELDSLSSDPFVVFFEPPSLDERIINQAALFSMMSSPTTVFEEWLSDKPELYRRIIIPAGLKWEVRDKLDQIMVNERTLFPGLDGLGSYLKRYYSPRQP